MKCNKRRTNIIGFEDLNIAKMLEVCGYNDPKSPEEIACAIRDMEKEGYIVPEHTRKIISSYFKMHFANNNPAVQDMPWYLKNRFTVDPTMTDLKEEIDRMEEVGSIIGDYIVPIGIYSGNILSVGASGKIYSVVASIKASVDLLGMDFDDFLLRYYNNSGPIFTWKL